MIRITCFNDLRPYGIIALTGESCGLSYRILFDVTEKGRQIVGRWLGIPELRLADSWNAGHGDERHVGSLLLSEECLVPLAVFCLVDAGVREVWLVKRGVCGIEVTDSEENIAQCRLSHPPQRTLRSHGTAGDRNVHMMSGRVT